ncbi:MAG: hypothetical protein Q8P12_06825 [bacterium]|nr:hypothetical protein [bacterium]
MAEDNETLESGNLEGQENEAEEQNTPDPVEERFTKLETDLRELQGKHQGAANYLGALGRQIETLLKQPPTVARDERVDVLLGKMENMEISLMPDPDEREKAYRERLAKPREAPPEQPAKKEEPRPVTNADEIILRAEYQTVQSELAAFAEEIGVPFASAWAKVEPRIQTAENPNGEFRRGTSGTASDPRAWRPFVKAIKDDFLKQRDQARTQAKPRTQIDTSRSAGPAKSVQDRYHAWLAGSGPKPSDAEIDSLTATYASRT